MLLRPKAFREYRKGKGEEPTMGASYNRRRYAADPEFRQGMIEASMQYQRKLAAEEPERAAEVRKRRAERARERYLTDPVYREACIEAHRRHRAKSKARGSAPLEPQGGCAPLDPLPGAPQEGVQGGAAPFPLKPPLEDPLVVPGGGSRGESAEPLEGVQGIAL